MVMPGDCEAGLPRKLVGQVTVNENRRLITSVILNARGSRAAIVFLAA